MRLLRAEHDLGLNACRSASALHSMQALRGATHAVSRPAAQSRPLRPLPRHLQRSQLELCWWATPCRHRRVARATAAQGMPAPPSPSPPVAGTATALAAGWATGAATARAAPPARTLTLRPPKGRRCNSLRPTLAPRAERRRQSSTTHTSRGRALAALLGRCRPRRRQELGARAARKPRAPAPQVVGDGQQQPRAIVAVVAVLERGPGQAGRLLRVGARLPAPRAQPGHLLLRRPQLRHGRRRQARRQRSKVLRRNKAGARPWQ